MTLRPAKYFLSVLAVIVIAGGPVVQAENIFPEKNFFEPRKPRSKEKLLNINERKRRADIKNAGYEKFLRAKKSELGQLKAKIKREPLKSYQAQLTGFSEKIKNLLAQLQKQEGVSRTVFLNLAARIHLVPGKDVEHNLSDGTVLTLRPTNWTHAQLLVGFGVHL